MDSQIWVKAEEKWAYILTLRGHEVHRLKVTGNVLTMKRNLKAVLGALEGGSHPSEAGAKSVESLDARSVIKAEVSPGNGSLTLHGEGDKKLAYSTGNSDADAILGTILAQSGRSFVTKQEDIGVVEALLPPVFIGALGGLFWAAVYHAAGKLAGGETVEAKGRRQGMQKLLIGVAQMLGPGGTVAAGVALLALILGWAGLRLFRRPQRTVWLPETV